MSHKFKKLPLIDEKGEECFVEEIGLSSLGYAMIKLYYPQKGVWVSHVLDNWDPEDNFIANQMDFRKKVMKLKNLQ